MLSEMNPEQGKGKSVTDATADTLIIYKHAGGTWRHS